MSLKQPITQVRLTNVAVVRLKRKGKRFEIACYRNKVVEWRNGVEKDISEVLQIANVFTNVSKGVLAKKDDLIDAFETDDVEKLCRMILEKGQVQVSDKERNRDLGSKFKDIATIVSEKCVNPDSKRPYPVAIIEKLMKDLHFNISATKNTKQQALQLIPMLQKAIPIERAQMRIRLQAPPLLAKTIKTSIEKYVVQIEQEECTDQLEMTFLIDPGSYRILEDTVRTLSKGKARIDVHDLFVQELGAINFGEEKAQSIQKQHQKHGAASSDEDDDSDDQNSDAPEKKKPASSKPAAAAVAASRKPRVADAGSNSSSAASSAASTPKKSRPAGKDKPVRKAKPKADTSASEDEKEKHVPAKKASRKKGTKGKISDTEEDSDAEAPEKPKKKQNAAAAAGKGKKPEKATKGGKDKKNRSSDEESDDEDQKKPAVKKQVEDKQELSRAEKRKEKQQEKQKLKQGTAGGDDDDDDWDDKKKKGKGKKKKGK